MAGFLRFWLRVALALTLSMGVARAHEVQPAVADVTVGAERVEVVLRLAVEPILAGVDLGAVSDTDESPFAGLSDRLRAMPPDALEAMLREAWPSLAARLTLRSEGDLAPLLESVSVPEVGDTELRRDSVLTVSAALPEGDAPVVFGWASGLGGLIVRQVGEGATYEAFLTGGAVTEPMPRIGVAREPTVRVAAEGMRAVVPVQALFVLGLFLAAAGRRELGLQVGALLGAEALGLGLAGAVPGAVAALAAAASLVWVAADNLRDREGIGRGRIALVAAFGLAHGASLGSGFEGPGASLATFAAGAALGQLVAVAAGYLVLAAPFGGRAWFRRGIVVPGSLLIGAAGVWLLVARSGLVPGLPGAG